MHNIFDRLLVAEVIRARERRSSRTATSQPLDYQSCFSILYAKEAPMLFHVTIEQDEDGWFVAECPALPGCVSQGKDEQEALANVKEAIQAWLWAEDQKNLDDVSASGKGPILVSV
jgi:predicted RNase H-like HicB family nuclease